MRKMSSILGLVLGLLLIIPYVGAFEVKMVSSGPSLDGGAIQVNTSRTVFGLSIR